MQLLSLHKDVGSKTRKIYIKVLRMTGISFKTRVLFENNEIWQEVKASHEK